MAAFDELINGYTADPQFIRRGRLEQLVLDAVSDQEHRIVLITAEPGAGKSGLLASLARQHPDWLRYFLRRDSASKAAGGSDATSLLLSIGHQLAAARPAAFDWQGIEISAVQHVGTVAAGGTVTGVRIEDLRASPFVITAIRARQEAGTVAGNLTSVAIGTATLEPRLLVPSQLQHLALILPATVLAEHDPTARIVVLIDALDEAPPAGQPGSIVDWLKELPELPPNVRIVATSRPTTDLDGLRLRQAATLRQLVIDSGSPGVRGDLMTYGRNLFARIPADLRGDAVVAEQRIGQLVDRADGNFAYLAAVARVVDAAVAAQAAGETRLGGIERLLDFTALPAGLDQLYALFIQHVHDDVARLPDLDVEPGSGATGSPVPAWEGVGCRLAGVLSVARDWLTTVQLRTLGGIRAWPDDVSAVLGHFLPFLDVADGGYQWFHASVAEYLTSAQAAAEYPRLAVHAPRWHDSIVRAYLGQSTSWAGVQWPGVDDYGINNIPAHLFALGDADESRGQLFELLSPAWRRERRRRAGTDAPVLADISLAIQAAAHAPAEFGQLVRCSLLYGTIRSFVGRTPPVLAGAWARMGQLNRAFAGAAAIEDRYVRVQAYARIARELAGSDAGEAAVRAGQAALSEVARLWDAHQAWSTVRQLSPLIARLALVDFAVAVLGTPYGLTTMADGLADGGATWPGLDREERDHALDRLRWHLDRLSEPDITATAAVARAFGALGRGSEGITLLGQVRPEEMAPLPGTDVALALATCGERVTSVALAERIYRSLPVVPRPDGGSVMNFGLAESPMVKLARTLVLAGTAERGVEIALYLFENGLPDAITEVFNDLAARGDMPGAGRLAQAALDRARPLPAVRDRGDKNLTMVLNVTTETMVTQNVRVYRDDLLSSLVGLLARAGNPQAPPAAAEVADEHKRQVALARLATGLAAAANWDIAVASLAAITDAAIHERATLDVIYALAEAGRADQAQDLVQMLSRPGARTSGLGAITLARARAGQVAATSALADQLDAESEALDDEQAAAAALSASAAQLADARLAVHAVGRAKLADNDADRAIAACGAVAAMRIAGRNADQQLTEEITAGIRRGLDHGQLEPAAAVRALCSAGLRQEASGLASYDDPQRRPLAGVGCAFAEAGEWAAAESVLVRVKDPVGRVQVLTTLGVGYAANGMAGPARERGISIKDLTEVPGEAAVAPWRAARGVSKIACSLAAAGATDDAVTLTRWVARIPESRSIEAVATQTWETRGSSLGEPAADAWQAIATEMARAGHVEQACALATTIADVAQRTAMLTALASTLVETRHDDAAKVQALAQDLASSAFDESMKLIPDDRFTQPTPENHVTAFGPWRWEVMLSDLGRNAARLGDETGATAAFDRVRRAFALNKSGWALTHLALRLAQAGTPDAAFEITREAMQLAADLGDGGVGGPLRWQIIDRVCQSLAVLGSTDQALQAADLLADPGWQHTAIVDLVDQVRAIRGEPEALAAVVAALSYLPGLSRSRVLGLVERCAATIAASDKRLLQQACEGLLAAQNWWDPDA